MRVALIRIPNAIRTFRSGTAREKSPFDFAAGIDGIAAFFEAKSTTEPFNFKTSVLNPKCVHQFRALHNAHSFGSIAGYLFHFVNEGKIVWSNVQNIADLIQRGEKTLTPRSSGITLQDDTTPIDLRKLMCKEIEFVRKKLRAP